MYRFLKRKTTQGPVLQTDGTKLALGVRRAAETAIPHADVLNRRQNAEQSRQIDLQAFASGMDAVIAQFASRLFRRRLAQGFRSSFDS